MATTVLYRKSSGEVIKISTKGQTFADSDPKYWGVLTDPTFTDGTNYIDIETGERRILGISKKWDDTTVRNSTQQEIDGYQAYEDDDEKEQEADSARNMININPAMRRLLVATFDVLIEHQFNAVREWLMDYKTVIANANNLADVKTGVAALPNLPNKTLQDLKDAVVNRISKDD